MVAGAKPRAKRKPDRRIAASLLAAGLALAIPAWLYQPLPAATRLSVRDGTKEMTSSERTWTWQTHDAWRWGFQRSVSPSGVRRIASWHLGPLTIEDITQIRRWPVAMETAAERAVAAREPWVEQARFTVFPHGAQRWLVVVDRSGADENADPERDVRRVTLREDGSVVTYKDTSKRLPSGKGGLLRN